MNRKLFILLFLVLISLAVIFFIAYRLSLFNNFLASDTSQSKASSCRLLEEKYCDKGKVETININGNKFQVLGFNLPEGSELMMPFDGIAVDGLFNTADFPLQGNFVIVNPEGNFSEKIMLIGSLDALRASDWSRAKGDVVGTINGGGSVNLNNYNLIILFYSDNEGVQKQNMEMFREYF